VLDDGTEVVTDVVEVAGLPLPHFAVQLPVGARAVELVATGPGGTETGRRPVGGG
jgi:hypothetical protein